MTTTVLKWTARCSICGEPMTGQDVTEPGKEPVREYGHDNPALTWVTDLGAHVGQPAEDTIQIIETSSY